MQQTIFLGGMAMFFAARAGMHQMSWKAALTDFTLVLATYGLIQYLWRLG